MDITTLLPLIGIPVVVLGFAFKFNPLLVVVVAGLTTGLSVGMDFGTRVPVEPHVALYRDGDALLL